MKNLLLTIWFASSAFIMSAQVPQSINYQAVARDAAGNPIPNTPLGIQFRILQGSSSGSSVYTETHSTATNNLGLFNLAIGTGNPVSGTFSGIDWSNFPYFLEVALDPAGGTNYQVVGASEMHSVPYALRSSCNCTMIVDGDGDTYVEVEPPSPNPGQDADEIHLYLGGSPVNPAVSPGKALVLRRNNPAGNTLLEIFDATGDKNLFIGERSGYNNITSGSATNPTGKNNTGLGFYSLANNGAGNRNTALGSDALRWNNGGAENTAVGFAALHFNSSGVTNPGDVYGRDNTAVGSLAMLRNEDGKMNTGIGRAALVENKSGYSNTAVGLNSMGYNVTGNNNVAVGAAALYSNKANSRSTAIGYHAMENADDNTTLGKLTYNTAVGFEALRGSTQPANNTGQWNTAIGDQALLSNTSGDNNTASGVKALYSNADGISNTAMGVGALEFNTSGSFNVGIGLHALHNNATSIDNTAVGTAALEMNSTGMSNTATGSRALLSNTIGSQNTANGVAALQQNTDGYNNTAVGANALTFNDTGYENTAIGAGADVTVSNLKNATAIGANAQVATDDSMILGDNNVNVGIGLSGVLPGPGNKLEVSAAGGSGLRFRNLTSNGPLTANPPSTHVLSVDAMGDVILVPGGGGSGLVGYCSPAPPLSSDAGTNLNGHNFYFENGPAGINQNNVGIGLACGASFTAKLHVLSNQNLSGNNTGIFSDVFNNSASNTGVYGVGSGGNAVQNIGVHGRARGATSNYGVYGITPDQGAAGTANFGVFGSAQAAPTNYGGYFSATGSGSATNYGVYATGANATTNNWAAYFVGDGYLSGLPWSGSDEKLKDNITPLEKATEIIAALAPKTYSFRTDEYNFMQFPEGTQFGLIAQDVERVLPEAVKDIHHPEQRDESGKVISPALDFKGLNYSAFIPILIQGMKEQQAQIETLQTQTAQLEALQKQNQQLQTQLDTLRVEMQAIRAEIGGRAVLKNQ